MSERAIERIVTTWPAQFFQNLAEEVDAAFARAKRTTADQIAPPERRAALGQLRHFCTEQAFRTAGRAAGLNAHVPDTIPKGACYSVVEGGGVFMIRTNVMSHCGVPRPTRFRQRWASLNAWLSPFQIDLLDLDRPAPSSDRLCAMLVVTASQDGDIGVPAFVGVGIPSDDCSTWLALEPIGRLIARYHDVSSPKPTEAPVEVKDKAMPKIRTRTNQNGG
ncbi:hypothetical protein [Rubellimicrobium aerolatum]|uniref:Uncharacterized protein n=1 Tax=Rubellimicrobium aerolatum TaxID=490979 RepID=A0ABW0SDU5_9RHOB|nr:hypothetical protein [Rubellimicrobium aerolatum]MBP1806965.1 hypothetical protein [Rubellimicrobium aerolatum]